MLDCRSNYDDLTLFSINVVVDDVVTELYGVVDSESDNDVDQDVELLTYLTQANEAVSSQSMARTKQTAKKTNEKGELPVKSTDPVVKLPSALPLAVLPRRSRRFLESDSELEQAANLFGMDSDSPARSTHSKSPASARGKSPARGSPGRSSRGSSPARSTPGRGSPMRGVRPTGGRGNSGRGRSVTPLRPLQAEPKPGTSGVRPGQAGYVNGGGGVGRSSPRYNLPTFSSDDKEDADDEDEEEEEEENELENEDEEEEMEVDFPKTDPKNQCKNKQPTVVAAVKNLKLLRAPKRGESGFAVIAQWNATA